MIFDRFEKIVHIIYFLMLIRFNFFTNVYGI